MPDGSEQPIGYVSRTLNSAERNYSQLEKGIVVYFWHKAILLLPFRTPLHFDYGPQAVSRCVGWTEAYLPTDLH